MKKHIVIGIMAASLALTGCAAKVVPDDQRKLDNPKAVSATDAPASTETPTPVPSMGSGLVASEPAEATVAPIDKGKVIYAPAVSDTEVSKNEKITISAGKLKPGTEYTGKLFYSEGGRNNSFIELGKFKVKEDTELNAVIVIPANLASGKYVISLESGEDMYLAPIKVG